MGRPKYRVVKDHKSSFPYALIAVKGDELLVGKEDPEMPNWYWCKNINGVEAWVPITHITILGNKGILTQDYNSVELDVREGEVVQFLGETLGWMECLNYEWRYGWIPKDKLILI